MIQQVKLADPMTNAHTTNHQHVEVVLITHGKVGDALCEAATSTLGHLPLPTTVVAIDYNCDPDGVFGKLEARAQKLGTNDALLVLTDLYGSTPSNIASRLANHDKIRVVAGLNLPMLIRVMNYPWLDLNTLADKALSGGKDGVINCSKNKNNNDNKNTDHH